MTANFDIHICDMIFDCGIGDIVHVESLVAPHPVTFCQHVSDCVNHLRDKIGVDIDAFDFNEKIIHGIQHFHRFFLTEEKVSHIKRRFNSMVVSGVDKGKRCLCSQCSVLFQQRF